MSQKNVKITVAGSAGRMGKMLVNVIDSYEGCSLVAATCHPDETNIIGKDAGLVSGINNLDISISPDPQELLKGEVIIDFTSPESTIENSFLAVEKNIGHVIGTTGLSKNQEKIIEENSKKAPIIYSANMSVGVNLLFALVKKAVSSIDKNWEGEKINLLKKIEVHSKAKSKELNVSYCTKDLSFDGKTINQENFEIIYVLSEKKSFNKQIDEIEKQCLN